MSAPAVRIPSPRRPLGAVPATPSVPAPRVGGAVPTDRVEGRHRRREDHVDLPAPRRERPRSTSPQAPGVPAPRPASPGSSAGRAGAAQEHRATQQQRATQQYRTTPAPARRPAPAPRPAGTTALPAGSPVPAPRTGTPDRPHGVVVAARAAAGHGRADRPSPVARTLDVLGRVGSITTIAAMLVLSAALAGLADGTPPSGAAAEVAVTTLR
ncbi:hypothetical protein FVA95_19795 [Pseudonocardia sp. EV170527-09]|uniref:hypothetical protein n=1 Tax=Pseudonocardia sp. EV170527-09 TaxID=2603411 RepID=UPI0011F3AF23|nr:hypothetical protein [Pseudonocardia sp. EV170527-09]KAA1022266.1 hypothetical protein FVA95_19795 [Pseudonocardia sp. EV170527-09]